MKVQEAVALVTELVAAYDKVLTPRVGVQGIQNYEVSEILKAANGIASKLTTWNPDSSDDIPF